MGAPMVVEVCRRVEAWTGPANSKINSSCIPGRAILNRILLPSRSFLDARRPIQGDSQCHAWNERSFVP